MSGEYVKLISREGKLDCAPGSDSFSLRDDEFTVDYILGIVNSVDCMEDFGHECWFSWPDFSGDIDLSGFDGVEFLSYRCMRGENLLLMYDSPNQYMVTGDTSGVLDLSGDGVIISRSRFGGGPLNLIDENGDGYQVILRGKDFYMMRI
jgi:hypothetical protein